MPLKYVLRRTGATRTSNEPFEKTNFVWGPGTSQNDLECNSRHVLLQPRFGSPEAWLGTVALEIRFKEDWGHKGLK